MKTGIRWAALLLCGLLASACQDSINYAYFHVDVKLDPVTLPTTLRSDVRFCYVQVDLGSGPEYRDLACPATDLPDDLGFVDYDTTLQGTIRFQVVLADITKTAIATGVSPTVAIAAGKTTELEVLVKAVAGATASQP